MTKDTLDKCNELVKQINDVKSIISGLKYRKVNTSRSYGSEQWKWILRFRNHKQNGPRMIVFSNNSSYGTDINLQDEDSELLDMIIQYYNDKQKRLEDELANM